MTRETAGFYGVTVGGLVIGLGLWVHSIVDRPSIVLEEVRVVEADGATRVQSIVKNESEEQTWCIEVEMSAIDIDGFSLASAAASSNAGSRLAPGQTGNFVATFEGLTQRQRDEQLDEYIAYVVEQEPC